MKSLCSHGALLFNRRGCFPNVFQLPMAVQSSSCYTPLSQGREIGTDQVGSATPFKTKQSLTNTSAPRGRDDKRRVVELAHIWVQNPSCSTAGHCTLNLMPAPLLQWGHHCHPRVIWPLRIDKQTISFFFHPQKLLFHPEDAACMRSGGKGGEMKPPRCKKPQQ